MCLGQALGERQGPGKAGLSQSGHSGESHSPTVESLPALLTSRPLRSQGVSWALERVGSLPGPTHSPPGVPHAGQPQMSPDTAW